MKAPGLPYRVKLNLGTSFGPDTPVQADQWPDLPSILFASRALKIGSADVLAFSTNESLDVGGSFYAYSQSGGEGDDKTILSFMDVDGDGHVDHVLKNPDSDAVWARLNQTGKSNLLSRVTGPLGGTIELDYARQGNVIDSFPTGSATAKIDMPDARWSLSRVTSTDGRGNRYSDYVDYRVLADSDSA
jgi:hypothetical protein